MSEKNGIFIDVRDIEDAVAEVEDGLNELESDILVLKAGVARGTLSRDAILTSLEKMLVNIKVVR